MADADGDLSQQAYLIGQMDGTVNVSQKNDWS